jgi:hypothetical protein
MADEAEHTIGDLAARAAWRGNCAPVLTYEFNPSTDRHSRCAARVTQVRGRLSQM